MSGGILADIDDDRTHGWWLFTLTTEQHIVPCNDTLPHEVADCACLPVTKPLLGPDEDFACFQVIHHAWDGRE